jgi:hypothetical protein
MAIKRVLKFDPENHAYTLNGRPVLSTTQLITKAIGNLWADMPVEQNVNSLIFGTAVHAGCKLLDEGTLNWSTVDETIVPRLQAWEQFRKRWDCEITGMEVPMASVRYQFAGTADRFVTLPGHDGTFILDIKTGDIKPIVRLQLAGYGLLYDETHRKKHAGRIAVQLKSDGSYHAKWFKQKSDYRTFLACLEVAQFKELEGC